MSPKKAVCRLFSLDLVPDAEVRAHVETLLRSRNMRWSAEAQEQTMVPRGCTVLPNPVGTAPGLLIERTDRMLIVLPGVPYEMREILDRSVVPLLAARPGDTVTVHRTLRTTGIPESRLAHRLGDLDDLLRGASLAFLPSPRGVRLRITAQGRERAEAQRSVDLVAARVLERAGVYVYGEGEQELEEVLGALLTERRLSLAMAESKKKGSNTISGAGVTAGEAFPFSRVNSKTSARTLHQGIPRHRTAVLPARYRVAPV